MSESPRDGGRASGPLLPVLGGGSEGTYRVETWGCQMNVLDGQRMAGQLEAMGLRRAAEGEEGGVVLLNTCAVREKAESKVFSELGVLARRKQENPDLVVGVTGCVAQVSGEEILERAPFVDFVAGTGQVERIGELVAAARRERRQSLAVELPADDPVYQFREISRESSFQAYVTIIEGCDQFCTFCIVPFTRGRERSRRATEIADEVEALCRAGYTEVTLLGQTVNAYADPETGIGLGALLRRVARTEGLRRLRFLTSHPRLVDDALIDALAEVESLSGYLHLPAQAGSDRILNRMKRRYTSAEYRALIARIRGRCPDVAISSDFIVGFPGETEEDFQATLDLVRDVRFASLFGFRYSPRPGTASARWGRDSEVPEEVAAERLNRLLDLQAGIQREVNGTLVGRRFEVLIDGVSRKGQPTGRTSCNRIVHLEGTDGMADGVEGSGTVRPGTYVDVVVTKGLPNSLLGRPVTSGGGATW
jgi:tRNA-2-methylthio-N6-dimethylallyladenosine synthase